MDEASKILEAIGALDEKFDRKFEELKKADSTLTEEVQRISRKQDRMEQDVRDLKSDTSRRFEDESQASKTTMEAIIQHVDESAKAFKTKAADIDALKKETAAQSAELAKQTAILTRLDAVAANPMVRRIAYLIGLAILAWLGSKGLK
jgi:FtsZ-binding cell division protein ZapB